MGAVARGLVEGQSRPTSTSSKSSQHQRAGENDPHEFLPLPLIYFSAEELKLRGPPPGYQHLDYKIFAKIDVDGSGFIDYSSWVVATINKEKLLTKEKLLAAFNLFDKDNGGSISADEVKEVLCHGQDDFEDGVWDKIINEIDQDGNGEIDFEEFCDMFDKMINVPDDEICDNPGEHTHKK